jgi:GNAT superfamily N-acetyltransferase
MSKPINRIITGQYPVVGMRRAKLIDIPILQTLIEQSLRTAGEGNYTPRQLESALLSIGRVDSHLIEEGTIHIATSGGEIVGIGGWSGRKARYPGDPTAAVTSETVDPATIPAYLRSYYVSPHWTRMGIATLLLDDSVTAAKQAGFKRMAVFSTPMSLPFFKASGFEIEAETEIALPDGVHLPMTHLVKAIT